MKTHATLQKNRKGFGYLVFDNQQFPDARIAEPQARRFFDLDRLEVEVSPKGEVQRLQLVEHRFKSLLGKIVIQKGISLRVAKKRWEIEIPVRKFQARLTPGDWAVAKIHYREGNPLRLEAEIQEVFGPSVPASKDVEILALEYGLEEEHGQAAVQEAERVSKQDPLQELAHRKDLRQVPLITIDGATARDFDDAVHVKRVAGGFTLWVAIADVSHYVRVGSALDLEAYQRATSVYFPERAFHMLPHALSEGLCSLKPKVPRLALVAEMEFDNNGNRKSVAIYEALMQSERRATYEEIEKEKAQYPEYFQLYQKLKQIKKTRGSVDFDLPESEILVDEHGEPTDIVRRQRLDSHRLIEEFMIAANEAVTSWAHERKSPFLYRIHEEPSFESLKKFSNLARALGFEWRIPKDGRITSLSVAELVQKLEGHKSQTFLNSALLRAMKKAVYSHEHEIHFGLASKGYTHFTSPIRRYPDLIVHRLLKQLLRGQKPASKELEAQAQHCSFRERVAQEADWEAQKIKKVRWMKAHLGEEFDGMITSLTERGFFVQLDRPWADGFVSTENMQDDQYTYNEERMVIAGRRKKRVFKIGNPVRIRVARADLERREVDFVLKPPHAPARKS